ncbi:MAG: ComF family protein [bacterium]|nr:ComF family protein [bacterium]
MVNQNSLKENIFRFLFPPKCLVCGKHNNFLCYDCYSLIPLENRFQLNKNLPKTELKSLDKIYWATGYKNFIVKKIIQNYKYSPFSKKLSAILSKMLFDFVALNELDFKEIDFLVPVPSSARRKRWRGFDHIEEICRDFSEQINLPLLTKNLVKIRDSEPQMNLSGAKRKENIQGAFFCQDQKKIQGKNILLVDDVFTTGATLEESAKTLKNFGAKKVYGLVIARD